MIYQEDNSEVKNAKFWFRICLVPAARMSRKVSMSSFEILFAQSKLVSQARRKNPTSVPVVVVVNRKIS